jgi:hypothetical protein
VHRVGKLGGSEAGTETQPSDNSLKEHAALLCRQLAGAVMTAASWSSLTASIESNPERISCGNTDGLSPAPDVNG